MPERRKGVALDATVNKKGAAPLQRCNIETLSFSVRHLNSDRRRWRETGRFATGQTNKRSQREPEQINFPLLAHTRDALTGRFASSSPSGRGNRSQTARRLSSLPLGETDAKRQ